MLNALLLLGLIAPFNPVDHVATYYTEEDFGGNPLYCSCPKDPLFYTLDTEPWVAVNVRLYQSGAVKCGQRLILVFEDGSWLKVRSLDSGPFDGYYVEDYPNLPIIDLPEHLFPGDGMSMPVRVYVVN